MIAVVAALWMMFAPPPATPASTPPPDVVQTQPAAQPYTTGQAASPPPTAQPDTQGEEPQTAPQPDILGQGAYAQQAWEARLHAAYDNAEARQGPLDGRWKITGPDGDELFVLIFSDPEGGNLVGAWRDLRRSGGADGSGYLSSGGRTADGIDVRFVEPDQSSETVMQLRPTADGRWGGELTESGAVRSVVMTRF